MPYPTIPITFTYNTPYTYDVALNETRYQEGVKRQERLGINITSGTIDVSVKIRNFPEVDEFLRQRNGLPFRIRTENHLLGEPDFQYICTEYSGPQLGYGLYQFNGKFEQVRTLRNA